MLEIEKPMEIKNDFQISRLAELFEQIGHPIRLHKKTTLIFKGEPCYRVIFVKQGIIRAYYNSESGKETTLYHVKSGGICIFSLTAALFNRPIGANLEVLEESYALSIPTFRLKEVLKDHPSLSLRLFDYCTSKMEKLIEHSMQLLFSNVRKRLYRFLMEKFKESNEIRLTHDQIAGEIATGREVVTRLLNELVSAGVIRNKRSNIQLLDKSFFTDFSGSKVL